MSKAITQKPSGVWSAAPTPLNRDWTVDTRSVARMVQHHLRLGVNGLFLAGTCGEGDDLPTEEKRRLIRAVVETADGRIPVAVRAFGATLDAILEGIRRIKEDGGDFAVIAAPASLADPRKESICQYYLQAVRESPLPVGLYDLGGRRTFSIPSCCLEDIYQENNVHFVKDSSSDPHRRQTALKIRQQREEFRLFAGNEFDCVTYLNAGYDGLMLGGGVFNGYLAGMIVAAVRSERLDEAHDLQRRMTSLMHAVYGGPDIECWLAGLKHLLQEMGIFSNRLSFKNYPLTKSCRTAIGRILESEKHVLFPGQTNGALGTD